MGAAGRGAVCASTGTTIPIDAANNTDFASAAFSFMGKTLLPMGFRASLRT